MKLHYETELHDYEMDFGYGSKQVIFQLHFTVYSSGSSFQQCFVFEVDQWGGEHDRGEISESELVDIVGLEMFETCLSEAAESYSDRSHSDMLSDMHKDMITGFFEGGDE